MTSDWTEPLWVQLLPPSNRWQLTDGTYAAIEMLVCDSKLHCIYSLPADGDAATPINPVPSASKFFTLFLLIMRTSTDAFGRAGQESHVGFFPLSDFAKQPALSGPNLNSGLVEVHHRAGFVSTADSIYTDLFPGPIDRSDVNAKVVRISPPIPVV